MSSEGRRPRDHPKSSYLKKKSVEVIGYSNGMNIYSEKNPTQPEIMGG